MLVNYVGNSSRKGNFTNLIFQHWTYFNSFFMSVYYSINRSLQLKHEESKQTEEELAAQGQWLFYE